MATASLPRPLATDDALVLGDGSALVLDSVPGQTSDLDAVGDESGYDPRAFAILRDMQERHFWYRGRHRFLLHAVRRHVRAGFPGRRDLAAVDLGGGCGGWIKYLRQHAPDLFDELALADPSPTALGMARSVLGESVPLMRADARDLGWRERWDVIFLLDVLEHIKDDECVLHEVYRALRPGGLAVIATPALQSLWSYNDDLEGHVRRYSRADFASLAHRTGFGLRHSRYFMFFLSPLLVASRLRRPRLAEKTPAEIMALRARTHRVPPAPLNAVLNFIFSCETPLGKLLPFPWGSSMLALIEKPI
jgi:SAM-dependent methyltransferase